MLPTQCLLPQIVGSLYSALIEHCLLGRLRLWLFCTEWNCKIIILITADGRCKLYSKSSLLFRLYKHLVSSFIYQCQTNRFPFFYLIITLSVWTLGSGYCLWSESLTKFYDQDTSKCVVVSLRRKNNKFTANLTSTSFRLFHQFPIP